MYITSNNFKLSYHQTLADVLTRRLLYEKMNEKQEAFVRKNLAYHQAQLLSVKTLQAPVKQITIIAKEQSTLLPVLQKTN